MKHVFMDNARFKAIHNLITLIFTFLHTFIKYLLDNQLLLTTRYPTESSWPCGMTSWHTREHASYHSIPKRNFIPSWQTWFSYTIFTSIKIFPCMFQEWGVPSTRTLNNTRFGTIRRFYNKCYTDISLGSTHGTVQHQLLSRCVCTVDDKEPHRCLPIQRMGLTCISQVTLITLMKMG